MQAKGSLLIFASIFLLACNFSWGCRVEVCRKRRDVVEGREVLLELQGCTGLTKPWVRQVAYCLRRSTAEIALKMRNWYSSTYVECTARCDMVREGTRDKGEVNSCVDCFKDALIDADFMLYENVTLAEIYGCVDQYVPASLSTELPVFVPETRSRGRVTLPSTARPENDWWTLTVRLPCKPPLFQFWNANCINSFAGDPRARDFVLAQNQLTHSNNIVFLATFNDACRFDIEDVEIVWRESVPGFAVPQISSFPSSLPPSPQETGSIFFDQLAYLALEETDTTVIRRKRSLPEVEPMREIGIAMPCQIRSFKVSDQEGNPFKVLTKGTRYLIQQSIFSNSSVRKSQLGFETLNFSLDFGYDRTGCIFGSSEPKITPNPSSGWLDEEDNQRVTCFTCRGATSEVNCRKYGRRKRCQIGEICQSEVRQITQEKVSITKFCKQRSACQNNWINNNRLQCRPGKPSSTCRCCCSQNLCNRDALQCT